MLDIAMICETHVLSPVAKHSAWQGAQNFAVSHVENTLMLAAGQVYSLQVDVPRSMD